MLSDCKVGCCTSPPLGLCVISPSGCLQTRVPLPLIKPLKQGLHPGKDPCVFACVCVHGRRERERERELCVKQRRGEGRQRRSSVCTCTPPHVIYQGRGGGKGEEEKRREGCGWRCGGSARQDTGSLSVRPDVC